jgi:hexosaminidase
MNAGAGGVADLLPTPKWVKAEGGEMPLTAKSRIVATDPSLEPLAAILSDEILLVTKLRLAVAEEGPKAGLPRRSSDAPEVGTKPGDIVLKIDPSLRADADIVAVQKKDGRQQVVRTRDFAHTIAVGDTAVVTGWDYRAVCEGTATLLQALASQDGKCSLPRMTVKDWPQADYTGTMIDAARQWIPPDCIKFTIEACRFWKLRYVQIHFSDDHAYTFGSKAFPELGSKNWPISDGIIARCYTQEEMKDLEAYAVARGVTIVPELETPGHSGAMARTRPDLFSGPGCMPMASEKLYEALDTLMGEMCAIFKASPYFHIGCDEANIYGVGNTPEEKEYMKKYTLPEDNHPLNDAWQVYIMHVIRMKQLCQKYGKMAIAWEGLASDKRVKDDIVVMTWYNPGFAAEMERDGWNVITVPWGVPAETFTTWNMYNANGHVYQRSSNVLGAQRPMWQMSEYSLLGSYVPSLCEREERTWGADTEMADEAAYRARMARSAERMFSVAAPVRVVTEGAELLGVADGLKGWTGYSGAMTVKLVAPAPSGAQIHYTLDGTDPTPQSPQYTKPLTMQKDFTLKAALFLNGRMLGSCNRVKYEWRDIAGWITEYQMAGPYTKENLPGAQLFDIPFDPEANGSVDWKPWKGSGATPWICDLAPHGDNRCGYLRTQIWSPKAQGAMLLIASDDGVKAWLNGKLVHQENKVQSYNDDPDKVNVVLKEGWNPLLLKITQVDGGWGARVRVVAADGNKFEGLKFKAE